MGFYIHIRPITLKSLLIHLHKPVNPYTLNPKPHGSPTRNAKGPKHHVVLVLTCGLVDSAVAFLGACRRGFGFFFGGFRV